MAWYGLVSILRERNLIKRERESRPPADCPRDGEPLYAVGHGQLRCHFCGWSWPEDASTAIR